MTIDPIEYALRMVLYQSLRKRNFLPLLEVGTRELVSEMEAISSEILAFFSTADSFDPDWLLNRLSDEVSHELKSERFHEALFSIIYDKIENDAADSAERGDFRALISIVENRGFLRTSRARALAADRMWGLRKTGTAKTTINADTLTEIIVLMVDLKCTEYRAKLVWLQRNPDVGIDALKKRLREAKKEPVIGAIYKAFSEAKKEKR